MGRRRCNENWGREACESEETQEKREGRNEIFGSVVYRTDGRDQGGRERSVRGEGREGLRKGGKEGDVQ